MTNLYSGVQKESHEGKREWPTGMDYEEQKYMEMRKTQEEEEEITSFRPSACPHDRMSEYFSKCLSQFVFLIVYKSRISRSV
jgi:hypothetical protein